MLFYLLVIIHYLLLFGVKIGLLLKAMSSNERNIKSDMKEQRVHVTSGKSKITCENDHGQSEKTTNVDIPQRTHESSSQDLQLENAQLSSKLSNMMKSLSDLRKTSAEKISILTKTIHCLRNENHLMSQQQSELKLDLATAKKEMDLMKKEIETLQSANEDLIFSRYTREGTELFQQDEEIRNLRKQLAEMKSMNK